MDTWFAKFTGRLVAASAILFLVVACGGGGGGSGNFLPDDGSGGINYVLTLTITDADGNPADTVDASAPVTLTVTVTRKDSKEPVAQVVVTVTSDIGVILPAPGTALTDANGHAVLRIGAGETLGAGTVTASVENPTAGGAPFEALISFRVGQAGLRLGHFEGSTFIDGVIGLFSDQLSAGGSAVLNLAIVDENGELANNPETILLQSGCAQGGLAALPAEVQTVNGQAQATYTANGCSGADDIFATLASTGALATATLTVAPPEANVIYFQSVSPDSRVIALKGTGNAGRPETATLTFQVLSGFSSVSDPNDPGGSTGTPLTGIPVAFTLSSDIGGIELQSSSGFTDSNGEVRTAIRSGSVSTSVRVIATIELEDGDTIFTTSDPIAITTGLPDQDSISLSTSVLNVRGALNFDGRFACLTVSMADRFNNPVVDNTQAIFTTEYGVVDDFCLTGVQNGVRYQELCPGGATPPDTGVCQVAWVSQDPRFPPVGEDLIQTIEPDPAYACPSHNGGFGACPDDFGAIRGLRTTILVRAVGEEDFSDLNGNGYYDEGEWFINLPEAFVDWNEDDVYTPAVGPQCPNPPSSAENCAVAGEEEPFFDFNGDQRYSLNNNPAVYNGTLCPVEGDGVWCSRELVDVRDDIVLVMSAETNFDIVLANPRTGRVVTFAEEGVDDFVFYIADIFNNRPANDVPIAVTTTGDCTITPAVFEIADSNAYGAATLRFSVEGDGGEPGVLQSGTITVRAGTSVETFGCRTTAPPDPNDLTVSGGG